METGKGMHIQYLTEHEYQVIDEGTYKIIDLPLIDVARGSKKSFKEFSHIVHGLSPSDQEAARAAMSSKPPNMARLPASLRPRDALGDSCLTQLILDTSDPENCVALKFFHSRVNIPMGLAKSFCDDEVKVVNYSIASNSDVVKKGFLVMLSQVKGEQWLTQKLKAKPMKTSMRSNSSADMDGGSSKGWEPTEAQLIAGIEYINAHAPLANSKNEQYLWVLLNVRDDESPLHGWPQHVVLRACANRSLGNSQAEPEWFFPLLLQDLNAEFLQKVVPLILPLMPSYGLMILGRAGIGKTPTAQILAMAVARHLIAKHGLDCLPGWRRSKQIDGFRERPGEINIPALLDDANLSGMNLEDLKSFLDVGETCLVDARYKAAKFARNQCRIVLNNEWDEAKEPEAFASHITWNQFRDMFLTACSYPKTPHLMAILKRTTVIIAGHNAVYVRLPSEHVDEPVHCFKAGGITEDWLVPVHKKFYGLYKQGVRQKPNDFDTLLEEEKCIVAKLLASPEEKAYIERAERHESWRREAGSPEEPPSPDQRPSTPQGRSSSTAADFIIELKEEMDILSPPRKVPRVFGVIDVEDAGEPSESQTHVALPDMLPEDVEENPFGHEATLG